MSRFESKTRGKTAVLAIALFGAGSPLSTGRQQLAQGVGVVGDRCDDQPRPGLRVGGRPLGSSQSCTGSGEGVHARGRLGFKMRMQNAAGSLRLRCHKGDSDPQARDSSDPRSTRVPPALPFRTITLLSLSDGPFG
jgi:hypothetical protein